MYNNIRFSGNGCRFLLLKMIEYKKILGPDGIPIYFMHLPSIVQSVACQWVMFTGSLDDHKFGHPGLHHWLEHVPFRGTGRFPGGYADTKGRFVRCCGEIGAYTNMFATRFLAHVPKRVWPEAFKIITDLVAHPLLRDEDIEAEREVIRQEISQQRGDIAQYTMDKMKEHLFQGHPFSGSVLGTAESLERVMPDTLRKAHREGYSRQRATFIISGNLDEEEVMAIFDQQYRYISNYDIGERRSPLSVGEMPFNTGQSIVPIIIPFATSMVLAVFPSKKESDLKTALIKQDLIAALFSKGAGTSPLYQVLRQERKLVYQTYTDAITTPDGGFIAFAARMEKENIEPVLAAFRDVLSHPSVDSDDRIDEVIENMTSTEMDVVDPNKFNRMAFRRLQSTGEVIGDKEYAEILRSFTKKQIREWVYELRGGPRCSFVFEGQ